MSLHPGKCTVVRYGLSTQVDTESLDGVSIKPTGKYHDLGIFFIKQSVMV